MSDDTGRPDEPDDVTGAQADPPPQDDSQPTSSDAQEPPDDDDTHGNRIYAKQVGVDLDG